MADPGPVAIDAPGVRAMLARERLVAVVWTLVGAVLLVAFVVMLRAEDERVDALVRRGDPDDPRRLTIPTEASQSVWSVWVMVTCLVLGGMALVGGPWLLARIRRQRRLLAAEPWRTVPIRYLEVPYGNTIRGLLSITEDGTWQVGTLASTARWNLARSGLRTATEADVVGRLPGNLVVLAPGADRLVPVRSSYTSGGTRRWEQVFGPPPADHHT